MNANCCEFFGCSDIDEQVKSADPVRTPMHTIEPTY